MKINYYLLTEKERKELHLLLIGKHGDVTVREARLRLMPNWRLWEFASFLLFVCSVVLGLIFFVPLVFIGMAPAVISTIYLRKKTDRLLLLLPSRHDNDIIDFTIHQGNKP